MFWYPLFNHHFDNLPRKVGMLAVLKVAFRIAMSFGGGLDYDVTRHVAVRLAQEPGMQGKTIVTVLPDSGERYLSSALFEGMFE